MKVIATWQKGKSMSEWICKFYASHAEIPEGHYDGEITRELIRCKECKKNGNNLCPMLFTEMKDTDFCSYAERKEE